MTDKPVDKDPQNSADDATTSLKQVVEAKSNSSVSDVFQIGGSVNNSTVINNPIINIHPLGNNHASDQQPSKNNQNKKLDNLPEKNDFFTGRVNELNQLAESIKSKKKVAISGLGGIGKTQTAIEFCYRQIANNSYQTILWVNAENEISFNNSYYGVADLLNLVSGTGATNDAASNQALKVDEVILLVKRWLANNHNWLMVLDNLEDLKLIKDYLPANYQGHVLITTQQHDLDVIAKTITLDKMDPNIGPLFLLKRIGLLSENDSLDKADPNDLSVAQEIVKEMDGLPLALDQVGAYIRQTQSCLQHYLNLYRDARHAAELRAKRGKHTDNHISVSATFQLAFDKVKSKKPIAAKVLEVCSFLDPNLIPEEIFTQAGNFLGDELATLVNSPLLWDEVLEILLSYSLIKRNPNQYLSIHHLAQVVIRELLHLNSQILLLRKLIFGLDSLLPSQADDHTKWPIYHKISISTFKLLLFETRSNPFSKIFSFEQAAKLFHQVALFYRIQGQYGKSIKLYQKALTIYKTLFGDNHISISITLNNIAVLYSSLAKYPKALELYLQAFSIHKHCFTNDDGETANYLSNIGEVYFRLDNYQQASNYYQQAFIIHKQLHNDNHSDFGLLLTNMGLLYLKQNNKNQALESFRQALHIHKLHNNLPYLTTTLQNLADFYAEKPNYNKALRYYKKALEINITIFGDHHPNIAQNYNNIGTIYIKKGDYQEALLCFEKSLNIKKMFFANDHPSIAFTLNNIGIIYASQNKYKEALDSYNQSLKIKKHFFGKNHPEVASTLNNIGEVYCKQGKYKEALFHFQKSLSIKKKFFDGNHLSIAITLANIAKVYNFTNKQTKAIEFYKKTLLIFDESLAYNHPDLIELLTQYSQLLIKLNKPDQAQPLLDRLASLEQSP